MYGPRGVQVVSTNVGTTHGICHNLVVDFARQGRLGRHSRGTVTAAFRPLHWPYRRRRSISSLLVPGCTVHVGFKRVSTNVVLTPGTCHAATHNRIVYFVGARTSFVWRLRDRLRVHVAPSTGYTIEDALFHL